jgi:hypothetical protein
MSTPSLIVTETLAQDEYQAYESIEVLSVVGTVRERTLPPVGPLAREAGGAIETSAELEAQVAAAWAAVHARLSRPSGLDSLPPAVTVEPAAPEWAAVHARVATAPAFAEGTDPQAVVPLTRTKVKTKRPVGFTAEDEAFFAEGERLAAPENYDFTDLDEPPSAPPRRSRPMAVPALRFNA